jgi:hypothetical protein
MEFSKHQQRTMTHQQRPMTHQQMPMTLQDLIDRMLHESFDYLHFFGHIQRGSRVDKSCFSQWYPSGFTINGVHYKTAEHFMMASKARLFNDLGALDQVLQTHDPKIAKGLGRRVNNFQQDVWEANCFDIVVQGTVAKFSQVRKR